MNYLLINYSFIRPTLSFVLGFTPRQLDSFSTGSWPSEYLTGGLPYRRRSQVLGILRCAWIRETSSVGLWRHVDRQCCMCVFPLFDAIFAPPRSPTRPPLRFARPLRWTRGLGERASWWASQAGRVLRSASGVLGNGSEAGDTGGNITPSGTKCSIRH